MLEFDISILEAFLRCDPENDDLESSGRSVGFMLTNSHTNKFAWCRVMTKNLNNSTITGFLSILSSRFLVGLPLLNLNIPS